MFNLNGAHSVVCIGGKLDKGGERENWQRNERGGWREEKRYRKKGSARKECVM